MRVEQNHARLTHFSDLSAGETTSPTMVAFPQEAEQVIGLFLDWHQLGHRLPTLRDHHGLALRLDLIQELVHFACAVPREPLHNVPKAQFTKGQFGGRVRHKLAISLKLTCNRSTWSVVPTSIPDPTCRIDDEL